MFELIIYALVFIATLLFIDQLLQGSADLFIRRAEVSKRLLLLTQNEDPKRAYQELQLLRGLQNKAARWKLLGWLRRNYTQSGLLLSKNQIILWIVALGLLTGVILWLVISSWMLLIAAIPICIIVEITFIVHFLRARRIKNVLRQLPVALDIIVRSLSAGHPLPAAIALVSTELPDPVGAEFGMLSDQLTYGTALNEAMLKMFDRIGADEIKLLAISVTVQQGSGGNLVEILENLSTMVRERLVISAKIKAVSAEGRIAAIIMSCFPLFLFFLLRLLVPDYFDPLWQSGYGTAVVVACVILMTLGVVILSRMVNFDF